MNTTLPIPSSRLAGLVERQVVAAGARVVAVASLPAVPALRESTLRRFLRALMRSLAAVSV